MREIDLNEQFIVYVIYRGCGKWYISDKEIWYLDYQKRIEAYMKHGYEIKEEYIDERRKDLLCVTGENVSLFLQRIENDICSIKELRKLYLTNHKAVEYRPSLYIDFDKKLLYSMYTEPASYEDYMPSGWNAEYKNFWGLISQECYWNEN